jgi:hypothetical protein
VSQITVTKTALNNMVTCLLELSPNDTFLRNILAQSANLNEKQVQGYFNAAAAYGFCLVGEGSGTSVVEIAAVPVHTTDGVDIAFADPGFAATFAYQTMSDAGLPFIGAPEIISDNATGATLRWVTPVTNSGYYVRRIAFKI